LPCASLAPSWLRAGPGSVAPAAIRAMGSGTAAALAYIFKHIHNSACGGSTNTGEWMRLAGSVPLEVLKRYEKWKDIAHLSGPPGLRLIRGFHDEALSGAWTGHRSSRLGLQWRVIYRVAADVLLIQVVDVNAHDYRKP
jgi:mRNA-degrading endonuclease YafQ of YafQ-DinJ toxin-antitoxin module